MTNPNESTGQQPEDELSTEDKLKIGFGKMTNLWIEERDKRIALESLSRWREIAVDGLPKEGERVLWLNHHGRIFHNSWERFTNQDDEWARRNFTHWRPIDLPTPNE